VLETLTPFKEPLQYGDMEPRQEFGAEFFPPEMYVTGDDEPRVFERSPSRTFTFFATPISDLELAPMNPALGQYFGVTEGVLVINVPARTRLNLRPGDVVLSVDGRRVSNPNQLFRALLSYDPNESIQLEVQRMKRRDTVTGQVGPD
jgi:predicted metalloprotease with PDZ domain